MGYGFYNSASKIRVRMLARWEKNGITPQFLYDRVKAAWEYRKKTVDTSSCRVIFSEADWVPGMVVDKYEDVLVVESLALGIDRLKEILMAALLDVLEQDGITIRGIFERSDALVRKKEGMAPYKGWLWLRDEGNNDVHVEICENGVKYWVDVENGQKTGFFLDQKYNRLAMQNYVKEIYDGFSDDIKTYAKENSFDDYSSGSIRAIKFIAAKKYRLLSMLFSLTAMKNGR